MSIEERFFEKFNTLIGDLVPNGAIYTRFIDNADDEVRGE